MRCFAFISYSRADINIAHWLHKKLEKYPYPKEMVDKSNMPFHERFLRKIFIDVKDLSVTTDEFTDDIKKCLEESRYLIVICSTNSSKSIYVQQEIEYFLKTHNNNTDLILPVFVDQIEKSLPPVLSEINILKRNCPIYNSKLDEKSEANLYCFYHVAAFLLKVDFTKLYNRYENYSKRKRKYKFILTLIFVGLLIFTMILMYVSLDRQKKLTIKQKELTEFEKNVFPLSVVFGYEKNFLSPTIQYLKENRSMFEIHILMPYGLNDLKHQNRIDMVTNLIKRELKADSVYSEKLPTSMKRGTIIGRISDPGNIYNSVYLDFASTTSTFFQILNYKKQRYPDLDEDEVIQDYTNTFISQTKELLKEDSIYVYFYVSKEDLIRGIKDSVQ